MCNVYIFSLYGFQRSKSAKSATFSLLEDFVFAKSAKKMTKMCLYNMKTMNESKDTLLKQDFMLLN